MTKRFKSNTKLKEHFETFQQSNSLVTWIDIQGDVQDFGCRNNGSYLGCLKFHSQYDHLIKYGKPQMPRQSVLQSWTTFDEFIELMAHEVKTRIISELKS